MIDQAERRRANAIKATDAECIRLRDTEGATQEQIDAADRAWVEANEAYTAAGYSLEALDAGNGRRS